MKKILLTLFLVGLTSFVILFSCKRDCDNCNNTAPIVKAGPDLIVTLPTINIVLDGSNSKDVDGKIVKWLWTKISGPASYEIVTKDSAITSVKNVIEGSYQFQLEVTDDGGLSAKDTVSLQVLSENHPPKAGAGADTSVALRYCNGGFATVILDGRASSDPDNNIANFLWRKISGPSARLGALNFPTLTVQEMVVGTYEFELTVTDVRGLASKDTIAVRVSVPVPQEYDLDVTALNAYLFEDNFKDCYYVPCSYYDAFNFTGNGTIPSLGAMGIYFYEYSDTAAASYATESYFNFYNDATGKGAYGRCLINFKKLIQDGGGVFTGTIKLTGGNAEQCVPNILTSLPPLTITGTMDTTVKRLTFTIKGKIYF